MPVISPARSPGMSSSMVWQPMPPPTRVPGAWVEELCGQPEQKNGWRGDPASGR